MRTPGVVVYTYERNLSGGWSIEVEGEGKVRKTKELRPAVFNSIRALLDCPETRAICIEVAASPDGEVSG